MSADNAKTDLVTFLQRYIGRTLTREDVVYTVQQHDDQYQAVCKLVCLNGDEFCGELCPTDKAATKAAAAQALLAYAAEIAALPPKETKTKSKASKSQKAAVQQQLAFPFLGDPGDMLALANQQASNHKTDLVQKLQSHCKRTMTKADILYETARIGTEFQATVRLHCLGGQEFVGEVCGGEKLAEHAAALQAVLNSNMWDPAVTPPPMVEPPAGQVDVAKRKAEDADNPKSQLVMYMQRLLRRTLTKDDIVYAQARTIGGIQATVQLNCLYNRQFAGEVCAASKAAEASAAQQALMAISAESGPLPPPPTKRQRAGSGGVLMGGAMPPTGRRKEPIPEGPRTMVIDDVQTGEVVDWNPHQHFGFIKPHQALAHPQANRNGKLYVHGKDLVAGQELAKGTLVQFRVYSDARGLGATDVMPF